ncbi:serine--tRNA ligase [bacterium]|nr:MAG: serine--tRNA ligase [bacterium]
MLDIKFIRENPEAVKKAAKDKKVNVDIDQLLEVDDEKKKLLQEIEELRSQRNKIAETIKKTGGKPDESLIKDGREIKEKIVVLEENLKAVEEKHFDLMVQVPTIPSEDTPIGKNDTENVEIYKWGEPRKFDFQPKSYMELAQNLDLLDFDRGVKVGGYRSYYVKNEGVMLQMGIMMYALKKLIQKGFTPMIPPTLVRDFALFGSGYFAGKKYNPEIDEIYKVANDEILADGSKKKEDKFLIGTAEPALLAYYANEVLEEKDLPLKICGFSQCYRSEIGSYGKDTKGIFRVHEFMKVEQVVICKADKDEADKLHQEIVEISKELHEDLKLPYRVIQICTGALSTGKYKQLDFEAWIPSRNEYGETGSASNFLDWQARRLNVKYKDKDGKRKFAYMMNDTALPTPRPLIAILENYQNADGSVTVPEVLREYVGKSKIV